MKNKHYCTSDTCKGKKVKMEKKQASTFSLTFTDWVCPQCGKKIGRLK